MLEPAMDGLSALTPQQRDIAHQALQAAFGNAPIAAITRLSGGVTSAAPLKIEVGGRFYLLRVEGEPSPLRNPHQYQSMRIAADAGIAPRLQYVDEDQRVTVMDFVASVPLSSYPGGQPALVQAMSQLVARLHTTPLFPSFVNYPDIVTRLFAHVQRTGLFAQGVLDPHVARLDRISRDYNAGLTTLVSCHNDPVASNILFDGTRLWLIDWESAYRNDPLVDLAIVLDTHPVPPELEDTLLGDGASRERLQIVRALVRLYYAGVLLSASAAAGWTQGETDLTVRHQKLPHGTPQAKHELGKRFLKSFLDGTPAPGLSAAP